MMEYNRPRIEIVLFEERNIILTSNGEDGYEYDGDGF